MTMKNSTTDNVIYLNEVCVNNKAPAKVTEPKKLESILKANYSVRDKISDGSGHTEKVYGSQYKENDNDLLEIVKTQMLEGLIKGSGLGEKFTNKTFDNYIPDKVNRKSYDKCLKYAENYKPLPGDGLFISGPVGTGKTHLAAAIANYIMRKYYSSVKFVSMNTVLANLRSSFREDSSVSETEIIRKLVNVQLLVLDDLGKESTSEWSTSIIYSIINGRYERNKPIIITTNYSPEMLEKKVGDATVSRIIEMCDGVNLKGYDYRKKKLTGE
jgi:DNA replication protein DnaC